MSDLLPNPLAVLCHQMGISPSQLAFRTGLKESSIVESLRASPSDPLSTYLKAAAAIGVKMRIVADDPLVLRFSHGAVHGLHSNAAFRRHMGLDPLPANRGELRTLIQSMHSAGRSYGDIVDYLERHYIPTAMGVRRWRRSTIAQHLRKLKRDDAATPIISDADFQRIWLDYAIDCIKVAIAPFDATASVRWGIQHRVMGEWVTISTDPLPACIKRWMLSTVRELGWFRSDEWQAAGP